MKAGPGVRLEAGQGEGCPCVRVAAQRGMWEPEWDEESTCEVAVMETGLHICKCIKDSGIPGEGNYKLEKGEIPMNDSTPR